MNNGTNPKSIPGAVQRYTVRVTNQGTGAVDNNSVLIVDKIPTNTKMFVGNLGAPGSGPVAFVNGTPSSALTWTFTALNNLTDDLDFSNDGGATWTYVPVADAPGYDAAVTDIRMRPKGTDAGAGRRQSELRAAVPGDRELAEISAARSQADLATGPRSSTFFMRSMHFSSVAMLVANEARKCPGAPKAEPGTTATPASSISISAKELSSLQPKAIMAALQSAQA